MTHRRLFTLAALTTLTLAACGDGRRRADASETPAAKSKAAAPSSAPQADTGLQAYVDHFPFDVVNGVAWNDHPAVKAGLAKTVTNAEIRRTIETLAGPSAPIERHEGKLMSWACEAHNCGPHQWSVLIDPSNGATDVCYYNESVNGSRAHWFFAAGTEQWRDGNCQFGED
ncbi:hypothetical protein [Sphingopyxis flava]|uniref:Inhibitor of vertebrate lysozyme (Ivy) n=1 Tax=Sphingopyxis flava TaxID=1507287 RepID=A0A1T5EZ06_9SPHN|nr:hypothetical protein [Sphingopyxis flava]SKB89182.1 hypothetical protein SAMN06295937_102653 [Sphingopyxis flava]